MLPEMQTRVRTHRSLWLVVFIVTAAMLVILNVYVFVVVRQNQIRSAGDDMAAIADNLADRVEQSLQVIEISLENLILRARSPGYGPYEIYLMLRQVEQTLPQIRAIAILDDKGTVSHSSRSFPPPSVALADRDHVAYYLKGGKGQRYLSGPSKNLVDNRWQISLSLPIFDAQGQLGGLITVVVDPQYFADGFVRTSSSHGDVVNLLYRDFSLVARQPWRDEEIGRSFADAPLYRALSQAREPLVRATLDDGAQDTGEDRYSVTRRLYNELLVLSVTRPITDILAQWRTLAILSATVTAALVLIELLAFLQADRTIRQIAEQETELWALNQELSVQTETAENLAEVKGAFLANMSHEIRTPLGGLLGYADLLLKSDLNEQQAEWVAKQKSAGAQLLAVINDVLDYSKIEAGEFVISPKAVALAPLIDEIGSMMTPQATARGLALRTEIGGDLPRWIRTDPLRVKQILINLTSNAIKFTDEGTVSLAVSATTLPGLQPAFRIDVADTGIGIPAEKVAKVFERFTQAETVTTRGRGGTGLGLSISRRLAELMGGTLTLDSREGVGTTVSLVLPLVVADDETPALAAAVAAPARSARILLVDDLPMNLEIAGAILRWQGHDVITAANGMEAIDLALSHPFDAILLDINLPDIDGYEVAREIRKLESGGRRTPILALTANALPEHVDQARAAGMDGHVSKPIEATVLAEKLAAVLQPATAAASEGERVLEKLPLIDRDAVKALRKLLGAPRHDAMRVEFWAAWESFESGGLAGETEPAALAAAAHDMVSQAGNIGYRRLSEVCRKLSVAAGGGPTSEIQALAEQALVTASLTRRQEQD